MVSTRSRTRASNKSLSPNQSLSPKKNLTPKKDIRKKKQVKNAATEVLLEESIKNCHPCQRKAIVALTCESCTLSFCHRHLVNRYELTPPDAITKQWPCPRCNGICDCYNCTKFYKKSALGSVERRNMSKVKDELVELRKQLVNLQREKDELLAAAEASQKQTQDALEFKQENARLREELQRVQKEVETKAEMFMMLQNHNNSLQQYIDSLVKLNSQLQIQANQKSATDSAIDSKHEALETCSSHMDDQISGQNELEAVNKKLKDTCCSQFEEISCLQNQLAAAKQELKDTCSSQCEEISTLQNQLAAARQQLQDTCSSQCEEISTLQNQLAAARQQLQMAENEVADGLRLRKKMHNTIMVLKGNLRVFCRVKPLLGDDGVGVKPTVSYPTSTGFVGKRIELIHSDKKYPFTFDKVFNEHATQEDVFIEISELVQSSLDGYRVCIFAYGQTGSGKTYSMMGSLEDPQQRGLIPRSLDKVFQTSQALAARGWKYTMQVSIFEIYNKKIKDLISGVQGKQHQYEIIHDTVRKTTFVSGLNVRPVATTKEVLNLLKEATKNRSVSRTNLNENSSRSHFVFSIRMDGRNETTDEQVQGVLNLVDLAGSEDPSKSGATGETLEEAKEINLSLGTLKSVLQAIANKAKHIPLRDSTLTDVLTDSLIGQSKTLMLLNISPGPNSSGESLRSLNFAHKAQSCEIGSPRRVRFVDKSGSRSLCTVQKSAPRSSSLRGGILLQKSVPIKWKDQGKKDRTNKSVPIKWKDQGKKDRTNKVNKDVNAKKDIGIILQSVQHRCEQGCEQGCQKSVPVKWKDQGKKARTNKVKQGCEC